MVPGGRYFRICVASASADTASFPLPHGRGGSGGLPVPGEPGIRAARVGDESGGLRTRKHPLRQAHSPSSRPKPPSACLWKPLRPLTQLATSSPTNPGPTCALGALRPHDARRSPPCPRGLPSLTWEERLGFSHAHTSSVGSSRQEQCLSRPPHLRHRGSRTERVPRAAAGDRNVPFRPPHQPPFPAPVHTSNQQRRRVRRAEVSGRVAEDRLQRVLLTRRPLPLTNLKPRKPESRELVLLTTTSSRAPGAAASDKEHGRPAPFAAAPSYCFTPAERAGEPPGTASANHASPPRAGPNLLASLCGARAERRRAHVLSRPESRGTGTGLKPGRESADLTSQGGCLSPAQGSGLVALRDRGVTGAGGCSAVPFGGLIFLVRLYN